MDVRIIPATDNWMQAISLQVNENQAEFVPSAAISLGKGVYQAGRR